MTNFEQLATLANAGGFTYDIATGACPQQGYAVSPFKDMERVYPGGVTADDVEAFAAGMPEFPGIVMGAWKFEGDVYLDASVVVDTPGEAMELARKCDQLAVYDLALGCTYYVDKIVEGV